MNKKIIFTAGAVVLVATSISGWGGYRYYTYEKQQEEIRAFQKLALDGYSAYAQGKTANALKFYEAAIKIHDDEERSLNNLAALYRAKGDIKRAREFYAKAYEINPDDFNAGYNVVLSDMMLKNYDKALTGVIDLIQYDGPKWSYYRVAAFALWNLKKESDALGYYAYLRQNNQFIGDSALSGLSARYDAMATKPTPKSIAMEYHATNDMGELEKLMKRYVDGGYDIKAVRTAQKILTMNPTHNEAHKISAKLYNAHGADAMSQYHLQRITKHDARTWEIGGAQMQKSGNFVGAIKAYEESYKLQPTDDLLRAISVCAVRAKDMAKFEESFATLEAENPKLAHRLLYALETNGGVQHTISEKVAYLLKDDWYSMVCAVRGCAEEQSDESKGV